MKPSPESFGKGVNIFGTRPGNGSLTRRSSFLSVTDDDFNQSPSGPHLDGHSGDEMPPTPTKTASTGTATLRPQSKGKGNSLRSSLFGRRSSLAPDTFVAPDADTAMEQYPAASKYLSIDTTTRERERKSESQLVGARTPSLTITPCGSPTQPSFSQSMTLRQSQSKSCPSPLTLRSRDFPSSFMSAAADAEAGPSTAVTPSSQHYMDLPQTPQESFTPPDPSGLSISGDHRGPVQFSLSAGASSFPPATPTGPRDCPFNFSAGQGAAASVSGYFGNDVDTTLTSRFSSVQVLGAGEFSQVYRVEKPVPGSPAARHITRRVGNVWAVKKSKKAYVGAKDRERKMREVRVLQALRGSEHVIDLSDHWESKGHLYIQTEFCENGNLKDFLTQTGFKGRLDDFRIWKILLEMSQVCALRSLYVKKVVDSNSPTGRQVHP